MKYERRKRNKGRKFLFKIGKVKNDIMVLKKVKTNVFGRLMNKKRTPPHNRSRQTRFTATRE